MFAPNCKTKLQIVHEYNNHPHSHQAFLKPANHFYLNVTFNFFFLTSTYAHQLAKILTFLAYFFSAIIVPHTTPAHSTAKFGWHWVRLRDSATGTLTAKARNKKKYPHGREPGSHFSRLSLLCLSLVPKGYTELRCQSSVLFCEQQKKK